MYRCFRFVLPIATALALAVPLFAQAQSVAPGVVVIKRSFTQNVLRGEILFGQLPELQLNGNNTRSAPGTRVRDPQNMLVTPARLVGKKFLVHYTIEDSTGLVKDIWILDATEADKEPWPRTLEEARAWSFDFASQRWFRP